ncbi:MAG TPA: NHL repeat-containing protein [Chloroflexota bacterium]|nr:NHL repeat-containing protein [Chloroflexota bacterium]
MHRRLLSALCCHVATNAPAPSRIYRALLVTALVAVVSALQVPVAAAQAPPPGELFVADSNVVPNSFLPGLIELSPSPGTPHAVPVPPGSIFVSPTGVAIAPDGTVYVVDNSCCASGHGAVIRVDPVSGAQTILADALTPPASTSYLLSPWGMAVAHNGTIYVSDLINGIIRVNPATGQQTLVSQGQFLNNPMGITITADGNVFVADSACCTGANGGIIKLDPTNTNVNANQTVLVSCCTSFFTQLAQPMGITVGSDGFLYAVGSVGFDPAVVRVDPGTGAQSMVPIPATVLLAGPRGIAAVPGGCLLRRQSELLPRCSQQHGRHHSGRPGDWGPERALGRRSHGASLGDCLRATARRPHHRQGPPGAARSGRAGPNHHLPPDGRQCWPQRRDGRHPR